MLTTGTDYLTLRSISVQDWAEDAKTAADLLLSSPSRMLVLVKLTERDGALMAREWLARQVQIVTNFHADQL